MKNLYLTLICIAIASVAFGQKSKGDQLFQQGKDLVDKEEFAKAAKTFLASRDEYLKDKNYERYFIATEKAIIIYQDNGEGTTAEKILREALTKIPTTPDLMVWHGKLNDHLGYTYLYTLIDIDKALACYTTAIDIFAKANLPNEEANERVNRAIVLTEQSKFQQAIDDLTKALQVLESTATTDVEWLAQNHKLLAHNLRMLGRYDDAIKHLNTALEYDIKSKELLASLFNDLGITYHENGSFTEALENLQLAKDLNESIYGKDADHYALQLINLANVYEGMGDLDRSMALFQEMATIYAQTPPTNLQDLIDVLLNLSRITNHLGMTDQSALLVQQALELAETSFGKNSINEADVYISMAAAAFARGEFDESLNYNFKSLSILEANKFQGEETYAMIYNNIGQAYDELYEIDLALKYKTQAVELYTKVLGPEHVSVAEAIGNVGLTYEMAGDYDKALAQLNQALTIRLKTQPADHDDVGTTYLNLGLIYLKKNDSKNAITQLNKARSIYDKYTQHINKAMIYNRLAAAYFMAGNKQEARASYQKAAIANNPNFKSENFNEVPTGGDYLGYYEQLITLIGKADLLTKAGDAASLKKAEEHLQAADAVLTEKGLKLTNARDRLELIQATSFFTEAGVTLADKLFQTTSNPIQLEKAFYYSERNKANEMYADVQRGKAVELVRIPRKLTTRQRELAARTTALEQQIAAAHQARNQTLITELKAKQFDTSKEYAAVIAEMQKQSPKFAALTNQRALPGWNDVKKMFDAKTALVSFVITDSSKYVLVGNTSKLVLKPLNKKTDLDRLVRGYRNFITLKNENYQQIGDQLFDEIWKPVEAALAELSGIENLVIIPDGPLSYVPFETLGKEKLLMEKYNIRYALSGALMVSQGLPKSIKKPSFIALAPVFNDKETSFVNKSCQRMMEGTRKADSTSRAFDFDGNYIAPLPATETEVEQIHKIHADKDLFAKFFTKENAREELIKKGELAQYDYIHFATHGIANSQYPELSGLLLSQEEKGGEDGVLYTGEILGLELKADLVTLSACETALGKKIEGEGVRGLTSAFLLAGANTVVVSLWKVADESTSLFMIEFYNQLLAGNNKSTALRNAKLKLLKDPQYQHPYYWAPFIQVGMN